MCTTYRFVTYVYMCHVGVLPPLTHHLHEVYLLMLSLPLFLHPIDEVGNHHSQQTITRTENQTLHVLTDRWELNNENTWTLGGEHHRKEKTQRLKHLSCIS